MSRVLIEVKVPAINETYDIFIPIDSQLGEITELVGKLIEHISEKRFRYERTTILSDAETGNIYDINIVVAELNITNGSRFILI